jgi:hypothetical protein
VQEPQRMQSMDFSMVIPDAVECEPLLSIRSFQSAGVALTSRPDFNSSRIGSIVDAGIA